MHRRFQLVIILFTVATITTVLSHSTIVWLKIRTSFGGYWTTESGGTQAGALMAGSSLAGDGLSWRRISDVLNLRIEGWGVAGSSPCEWEQFQHLAKETKLTFIVVSFYDLNENFFSDFRAEAVPLRQSVMDIWESRASWSFSRRLLSLYPLAYVRKLFPTAGRSEGVMVGVREKLVTMARGVVNLESEAVPTFSVNKIASIEEGIKERISNWPSGKMLRRLAAMKGDFQGKHSFKGPKHLSFLRMLHHGLKQGQVIVVVLPVSPAYGEEFLPPPVKQEFEQSLADARQSVPQAIFFRLDEMEELNSNDNFWDLVHMNSYGQKIATEALLGQFTELLGIP